MILSTAPVEFETVLPIVRNSAARAFAAYAAEAKEEAIADCIATAFIMYSRLKDKGETCKAWGLYRYAIQRVKSGRYAAQSRNRCDVMGQECARYNGTRRQPESVLADLADDSHNPADIVATKCDYLLWLNTLSDRGRKYVRLLIDGHALPGIAEIMDCTVKSVWEAKSKLHRRWRQFWVQSNA